MGWLGPQRCSMPSSLPQLDAPSETHGTHGTNYFGIMHLTQILTQRRQGAKKSIGFELLPSPLAGEGAGGEGLLPILGSSA